MIEHNLITPDQTCTLVSPNLQWLADIICHLRDDLAEDQAVEGLPQNAEIFAWVQETYYPGLHDLTWEEAVLSLLYRMQHSRSSRQSQKTDFASEAMVQLRRATRNSTIWQV
jgi:hypothetical protein